jgi:hypothetical protein
LPNGEKYNGEWKNGLRNGMGVYTLTNGEQYVMEWRNDFIYNGTGEIKWENYVYKGT